MRITSGNFKIDDPQLKKIKVEVNESIASGEQSLTIKLSQGASDRDLSKLSHMVALD